MTGIVGAGVVDGGFPGSAASSSTHESGGLTVEERCAERCEQANIDIEHIEHIDATSDIDGAAQTAYVVTDALAWDGPVELRDVQDVAIVGIGSGVRLEIPAEYRSYAVEVRGGNGFLWSGIDIDQRAPGAWGRLFVSVDTRGVLEDFNHLGSGRATNAQPDEFLGGKSGPTIYLPALSEDGSNAIRNWTVVFEGLFPNRHFGDRPIGIWLGPAHEGELWIEDSHIESFANNALYATNIWGEVHCRNVEFIDNGVSNGRIVRGSFIDCVSAFDAEDSTLGNADAANHATQGLACEADTRAGRSGGSVTIRGCEVRMGTVVQCGGGIDCRSGHIETIENTSVSVSDEAWWGDENAQDIVAGGTIGEIRECELSGSADSGVSIWNTTDEAVALDGVTIDYPAGRQELVGAFD